VRWQAEGRQTRRSTWLSDWQAGPQQAVKGPLPCLDDRSGLHEGRVLVPFQRQPIEWSGSGAARVVAVAPPAAAVAEASAAAAVVVAVAAVVVAAAPLAVAPAACAT